MKYLVVYIFGLMMLNSNANACSPNWSAVYHGDYLYLIENNEAFFILTWKNSDDHKVLKIRFEEKVANVNADTLRLAPSFQKKNLESAIDIYYTDGDKIIWNGQIIENQNGDYPIDVKTFKQQGYNDVYNFNNVHQYASDKNYIYYQGKKSDDNAGIKTIDLQKLQELDGAIFSGKSANFTDGEGIYYKGKYQGKLDSYKNIVTEYEWCPGRRFKVVSIDDQIYIDGTLIEHVDRDTFKVEKLEVDGKLSRAEYFLRYSDKNGEYIAKFNPQLDQWIINNEKVDFE